MNAALIMAILAALLLALEVPVSVALGLSGAAIILIFQLGPLLTVPQQVLGALDSFTLLAIPLFLVAGNLLGHGETSRALIHAVSRITQGLRGGLGLVAVIAALLLAGISGSGPADVAALTLVLYAPLVSEGFKKSDAAALLATGGGIGIIVPPSIALIIFGLVGDVSVERLFLAGVFPGLLVAGALVIVVMYCAGKGKTALPPGEQPTAEPQITAKERDIEQQEKSGSDKGNINPRQHSFWGSLARSLGALGAPVLMLGGLYSGLFADATEAAAVVIFYILLLELLIFRGLTWQHIRQTLRKSVTTSAQVLWLVACASIFAWVLHRTGTTVSLAAWIAKVSGHPLIYLLLVNVMLLVLGCVIDAVSLLYIFTPIFLQAGRALGVDDIHLGVIIVTNLAIGQVTPPVGVNLFVAASATGESVSSVGRAALKFVLAEIVVLAVIVLWPDLSLWLPSLLHS